MIDRIAKTRQSRQEIIATWRMIGLLFVGMVFVAFFVHFAMSDLATAGQTYEEKWADWWLNGIGGMFVVGYAALLTIFILLYFAWKERVFLSRIFEIVLYSLAEVMAGPVWLTHYFLQWEERRKK